MRQTAVGILIGLAAGFLFSLVASFDSFPAWILKAGDSLYTSGQDLLAAWKLKAGDSLYTSGQAHVPVAVIAVDEETIHLYGQPEAWPSERYAALFQHLRESGARIVALDFLPPPTAEAALSETSPDGLFVLPVLGAGTPSSQAEKLTFPHLLGPARGSGIVGHIHLCSDPDGAVRRVPLWIQSGGESVPALAWRAVALHLDVAIPPPMNLPFAWAGSRMVPDASGCVRFRYPLRPEETTVYPLRQLLEGDLPTEALAGQILFLGVTARGAAEFYPTPVGELSGVEIQAQIATALLTGQILTPVPLYFTTLLTLVAALLSAWVMVRVRQPLPLFISMLTIVGGVLSILFAASSWGWEVELLSPLIGSLAAAGAAALWRSYDGRRRREWLARLFRGRASPRLIAHLLQTPDGDTLLNADIRFVVALFADVRGFVRLTEGQDPRMVREAANIHLSIFTDAVVDAGGMVTKYMGDMVAAIFNAPLPVDRPVDQALWGARQGQQRLKRLWREHPNLLRLPMGVGIHAGTAVVGLLGSSYHQEYDAIGDTVNVAARLSTYAPAGEIYVTEAVVASAGKEWGFEPLGVFQVRGRYEPVIAYRLMDEE